MTVQKLSSKQVDSKFLCNLRSHSCLLIESSNPQDFAMTKQVEELRLLGGHQIREPLLEVLKDNAVLKLFLTETA